MLAITKWTLKQRKWSIVWWTIGISALIVLTLAFYPTIRNQTSQLDQSFNQLPESAKALFTDTQDLFSPVGYLSSQLFYLMLPLTLSIFTISLGSSLVAREESDATIELLLSRPISRGRLVLEKALAGLSALLIVSGITMGVTLALCRLVNMDVSLWNVSAAYVYSVVLAALFGAIAFWAAGFGRAGRLASIGLASLIGIGGYIISSLASVVSWLKWPANFLPHHYYHPGDILYGRYSWTALYIFLLIIAALGILTYVSFRRRDLSIS